MVEKLGWSESCTYAKVYFGLDNWDLAEIGAHFFLNFTDAKAVADTITADYKSRPDWQEKTAHLREKFPLPLPRNTKTIIKFVGDHPIGLGRTGSRMAAR